MVSALRWEWIAIGYFTYLLGMSLTSQRFARARVATLLAAAACVAVLGVQILAGPGSGMGQLTFAVLVPMPVLLIGYWLSGLFFVEPMRAVERALMAVDERFLGRTGVLDAYAESPQAVREVFETAYVLVYPVIPAAVATLAFGGHPEALPRFWATVLLAEFASYGMLPWLQTRPPRAIEERSGTVHPSSVMRRFNAAILDRGSIQVNTIPSGHAAGAVATALAVADVMPEAGMVFLALAAAIVAATVLGRYHYLVDSLLGPLVATGAWFLCR